MGAVARLGCCTFLIYISWGHLVRFDSEYKDERYRVGPRLLYIAKVVEGTVISVRMTQGSLDLFSCSLLGLRPFTKGLDAANNLCHY